MWPAVIVRGVDGIVFAKGVEGSSSAFPNGVPGAPSGVAGTDCSTAAVPGVVGIAWPGGVEGTESKTFTVPGVSAAIFGAPVGSRPADWSASVGVIGAELTTGVIGTEFITWEVFGVMGTAK